VVLSAGTTTPLSAAGGYEVNRGIAAIGAALLAIGISACASTASPSPTASTHTSVSPSPSPSGPRVYAVGQTMTNGAHQTVTVTAFAQGVAASEFSTPNPGDQCVSVQVKLVNGDSSPWDMPLFELAAVDASGQSYDSYSSFDCPSSTSVDSLVSGGHASATLYFEVPLSGRLILQWTPSALNATSVYNTELKAS
jgi:hypothetical protein